MSSVYCAFDKLNSVTTESGEEYHTCAHYGKCMCNKCESKYDGGRIKEYLETHERVEH